MHLHVCARLCPNSRSSHNYSIHSINRNYCQYESCSQHFYLYESTERRCDGNFCTITVQNPQTTDEYSIYSTAENIIKIEYHGRIRFLVYKTDRAGLNLFRRLDADQVNRTCSPLQRMDIILRYRFHDFIWHIVMSYSSVHCDSHHCRIHSNSRQCSVPTVKLTCQSSV